MTQKLAIGIDLGGTNLRCALVDENGKIIQSAKAKTPVAEGPEATSQKMNELIRSVLASSGSEQIVGVGIGSPGPLSRSKKMIFQTPNLPGFDAFPLGVRVEELSGQKVFLDNDAKSAAFGEMYFGVAQKISNFILMTLGTGIGGGIFQNGQMIYGKSDGACEIGHLTLYPEGNHCKCGNRGCFEQYCSATAIERRASLAKGKQVHAEELFTAYQNGERWALECCEQVAKDLAVASASLVNIFEPSMIVFGGGIFTEGGGPLISLIKKEIIGRCFKSSQEGLEIKSSSLAGNAGVLGAAAMVFHHNI